MKKVDLILCLIAIMLSAHAQSGAQLLAEKAAKYYNLMEVYKESPNLSMYLANRYFQKAGELGLTEAYIYSSKLNEQGYYVTTEDYSENLKEKAEAGNSEALYAIAQCYQFGWGIDKDVNQAKKYYLNFINSINDDNLSEDDYNKFLSACVLVQCIHIYEFSYLSIATSITSIIDQLKDIGQEDSFGPALFEYGLQMVNEKNKKKNYKKGVKAIKEAALLGNHAAKVMMCAIYKGGLYGEKPNEELADYWYNKFIEDNK